MSRVFVVLEESSRKLARTALGGGDEFELLEGFFLVGWDVGLLLDLPVWNGRSLQP